MLSLKIEIVISWLYRKMALEGERDEWVSTQKLGIKKSTLNLVA